MLCPKTTQWRNNKWLLAQREFPCVFTNRMETEVAHIRKGTNTGKSQKPHDFFTLPLHHALHREQHQGGELSFYQKYLNEYPLVMMEMVLSHAKLRCLAWLVENGMEAEAIKLLEE